MNKGSVFVGLLSALLIAGNCFGETIYQQNFESGKMPFTGTHTESNGTIAASTDQAYSGSNSAKINITADTGVGYDYFFGTDSFNTVYLRFRIYLSSTLTNTLDNDNEHFSIFKLLYWQTPETLLWLRPYRSGGANYLLIYYDDTGKYMGDGNGGTFQSLPSSDVWHTIEIKMVRHSSAGTLEYWLDGVSQDSATGLNTGDADVNEVLIGCDGSSAVTGAFYIDDIVLDDSKYIGTGWRVQEGAAVGSNYHY